MHITEIRESINDKGPMCPFLGLKDDPTTALSFPSSGNHCFHARPVLPVKLGFQRNYCLSHQYTDCEEFIRKPDSPLPADLRYKRSSGNGKWSQKTSPWIFLAVFAVIILAIWIGIASGLFGNSTLFPVRMMPAASTEARLATLASNPVEVQHTPTPTSLPTATATQPEPSPTPTQRPPHALETPIGIEHQLIIHQVLVGESLSSIAYKFMTTDAAIRAVNFKLQIPLSIGAFVIIPTNQTDVHEYPAFEAYKVLSDTDVETLAQQLSIDPVVFKRFNNLVDGEMLQTGQWLLVPRTGAPFP
jgi:hypothetical protein